MGRVNGEWEVGDGRGCEVGTSEGCEVGGIKLGCCSTSHMHALLPPFLLLSPSSSPSSPLTPPTPNDRPRGLLYHGVAVDICNLIQWTILSIVLLIQVCVCVWITRVTITLQHLGLLM